MKRELTRILNGRSLISAFLSSLGDAAHHFSQVDSEQKLTHLLDISPCAREICRKFCAGKLCLLNATYKTNKFEMPLFHVVGATSSHQIFTFSYYFMQRETAQITVVLCITFEMCLNNTTSPPTISPL